MTPRGWALFAGVVAVWGIPYFFIKIAVDAGMPPAVVAWGRVALAALVLLPVAWWSGQLRGLREHWKPVAAFAVAEIAIPFPLIAGAEQWVSSSLTAILIATVPLMVAIIALRFDPSEGMSATRLVGLLVGFAGVILLLGLDVGGQPQELLGAAMILLASVGYAIAPMIVKHRLSDLPSLGPVTGALAIGAVLLTPLAAVSAPTGRATPEAIAAVVILGVVCSAIAFVLFFGLIKEAGPSRASVITYITPLVAVALGVAFLDETVGPGTIAGMVLILAGSWIATRTAPTAEETVAAG